MVPCVIPGAQDAEFVALGVPKDLPAGAVIDVGGELRAERQRSRNSGFEVRGAEVEMQSVLVAFGLRHGEEQDHHAPGSKRDIAIAVDVRLSAHQFLPPGRQPLRVLRVHADALDAIFEEGDAARAHGRIVLNFDARRASGLRGKVLTASGAD